MYGPRCGYRTVGRPCRGGNGPGPSKRPRFQEEEDVVDLLEESEALELVELDPEMTPQDSWEPPSSMERFLERHFN